MTRAAVHHLYPDKDQVADAVGAAVVEAVEDVLSSTGMASYTADQLTGALEGTTAALLTLILRFTRSDCLDDALDTVDDCCRMMRDGLPIAIEIEKQHRMEAGDDG